MKDNRLLNALNGFKQLNYERVSVSEICFKTKIPRHVVIASLKKYNDIKTCELAGETYVIFAQMQKLHSCELPATKNKLLFGDLDE